MWRDICVCVCMFAENFLLDDVRNYRYLTHGNVGCTLDDHELYQELVEAFDIMGLNTDEKAGNYNVSMHVKKAIFDARSLSF